MAVNASKGLDRGGVFPPDQHPIGILQIADRRALRQKFGVGEHREALARRSHIQDRLHRRGRAHRQGALLHNDRVAARGLGHRAGAGLQPLEIAGLARPQALGFGGRVHRQEHHVGRSDRLLHRRGEMQIAAPAAAHHHIQAGLIDRQLAQIGIVPSGDPLAVEIHHGHLDLGATIGNHSHRWTAHIARADTANAADGL